MRKQLRNFVCCYIMSTSSNIFKPFLSPKYYCEHCDYTTSKKSNINNHNESKKHKNNVLATNNNILATDISEIKPPKYNCDICDKNFKERTGLWRHHKKYENNTCIKPIKLDEKSEMKTLTNLVLELVRNNTELQKQNQEFQIQVMDICKNSSITNISNNNSHNKTFNLQVFLNEECKDAMNLSEFIESIHLKLPDLLNIGKMGYTEGISKIILKELSETAQNKRPVHCSDVKREILYIKDENKWEKEQRNNPNLRDAIKSLSFKNMKLTNLWSNTYPESKNNESRLNDVYMKLVLQSTGGSDENEDKIIRKIARDIFIDKNSIA